MGENRLFKQEIYKDKWLIIVGLPLISFIVQHIGLSWEESKDWFFQEGYWLTFFYNFLGIFLILLINKFLILELDKRIPYRSSFSKRVLVQIGISLVLTTLIGELHTWIYVRFLNDGIAWPLQYTTDFPFAILITILLNFIYIGFFLQREARNGPASKSLASVDSPEIQKSTTPVEVSIGAKKVWLYPNEILLILSKEKITRVLTQEGKRYIMDIPLIEAIKQLDEEIFFQANRQVIIHRGSIRGYQKLPNRKLALILHKEELFSEPIYVSKEKSPQFLRWLSA